MIAIRKSLARVHLYNKVKRNWLATLLLVALPYGAMAQEDPLYRMEAGGTLGLVTYLGDFNGGIFRGAQPMGGLVLRRVINPYMDLRLAGFAGKIKGSSQNNDTYYPAYAATPYHFNRRLVDVSVAYEYNFWPYGTGRDYRGAQPLTPYIVGGLGLTHVSGGEKNVATANLFLGVGVKYKLADRLNLGLEWAMHFAMSDKLDGVADPYTVGSVGMFKNKDGYSAISLSLTYSFMPKCRTCNKDD